MSGVWVVRTEPWVTAHPRLRQDVWSAVMAITGVAALTDLEVISLSTLEEFLLPADPDPDESLAKSRTAQSQTQTRKRK
jgi:hypothetical protein